MPRYLFVTRAADKGSARPDPNADKAQRATIERAASALEGQLEKLAFAFGDDKVYTICQLPTNEAAASFAATIRCTYATHVDTVRLPRPPRYADLLPPPLAAQPTPPLRDVPLSR